MILCSQRTFIAKVYSACGDKLSKRVLSLRGAIIAKEFRAEFS